MQVDKLIKRCIKKDALAWNEFVKRYKDVVTRSVRYKLNKFNVRLSRNEFQDVVQEIFLSIWEKNKLSMLRNVECLKSWLAMIAFNMTSNYCRRIFKEAKRTRSLNESLSPEDSSLTLESVIACNKLSVLESIEAEELRQTLEREIVKLEPRKQLALKLNIYDGKTQEDITNIMNIPEGTVATLIRRAKSQVREGVEEYYKERRQECIHQK